MSDATDILDLMKTHFGGENSRKLIGLTNMTNDNSVTTINDDVLLSHCNFAIGRFRMETGHTVDTTSETHQYILVACVVASLENAKGRDTSAAMAAERFAVNQLISLRKKSRGYSYSSSKLKPSTEIANSLPDSDREQPAFTIRRRFGNANRIREFNE